MKILLEEYTGHKCNNCPEGHEIVAKMQKVMQDTLVVLAIHATKQAEPDNNTIFSNDYRTETGNNYSQVFGITSLPKVTINRKQFNADIFKNDEVEKIVMDSLRIKKEKPSHTLVTEVFL